MADDIFPSRPDVGEVAGIGSTMGTLLAPYIGELSPHPRELNRYRQSQYDDFDMFPEYRRTLADEQVYSALSQRLDAAIAIPWSVEPGGTMRRDRQAADDLREQLGALDFNSICRQMLFGVWYGYAVGETMWSMDAGRVRLDNIRVRAPDRFRWGDDHDLLLRTWARPRGEPVGPAKFWVLTRPGEHGDQPHGAGLARWCYWPAWLRRNGHRFWATTLERFGSPIPVGRYPKGDMQSQAAMLRTLQLITAGSGVALPEGQDLDLLFSLRSFSDQDSFSKYMDSVISKVILGQSSTTEQGPWRGTAEVQKDVRDEVVASDCRLLDESFMSSIATWITTWNFPGAAIPKMTRDAAPPEDLDTRATREKTISKTTGLRPTQRHVEQVYGGEWEVPPEPSAGPGNPDRKAVALASPRDGIEAAAQALLDGDGWEPLMDPVVEPILAEASAALARGDGLGEFRDQLPELFAHMDDGEMVQTLRRMGFSATLSGMTGDG